VDYVAVVAGTARQGVCHCWWTRTRGAGARRRAAEVLEQEGAHSPPDRGTSLARARRGSVSFVPLTKRFCKLCPRGLRLVKRRDRSGHISPPCVGRAFWQYGRHGSVGAGAALPRVHRLSADRLRRRRDRAPRGRSARQAEGRSGSRAVVGAGRPRPQGREAARNGRTQGPGGDGARMPRRSDRAHGRDHIPRRPRWHPHPLDQRLLLPVPDDERRAHAPGSPSRRSEMGPNDHARAAPLRGALPRGGRPGTKLCARPRKAATAVLAPPTPRARARDRYRRNNGRP
jgi:hypothetical protein